MHRYLSRSGTYDVAGLLAKLCSEKRYTEGDTEEVDRVTGPSKPTFGKMRVRAMMHKHGRVAYQTRNEPTGSK